MSDPGRVLLVGYPGTVPFLPVGGGRVRNEEGSVADPDPHVFGPPGSGSGSTSQRYGSGSGSCSGS